MFNFCTNPHLTVSNEVYKFPVFFFIPIKVEILYEIQESDKSEINSKNFERPIV